MVYWVFCIALWCFDICLNTIHLPWRSFHNSKQWRKKIMAFCWKKVLSFYRKDILLILYLMENNKELFYGNVKVSSSKNRIHFSIEYSVSNSEKRTLGTWCKMCVFVRFLNVSLPTVWINHFFQWCGGGDFSVPPSPQ